MRKNRYKGEFFIIILLMLGILLVVGYTVLKRTEVKRGEIFEYKDDVIVYEVRDGYILDLGESTMKDYAGFMVTYNISANDVITDITRGRYIKGLLVRKTEETEKIFGNLVKNEAEDLK